jgi:DNA-directed RNA polymerase subunit RPC12/RpoP
MTPEFELPCVDCGQELVRQRISTGSDDVTVAQCPDCGSRYYPEDALGRV